MVEYQKGPGAVRVAFSPGDLVKRIGDIAATNGWTNEAAIDAWLTSNVTTLAQARNVLGFLIKSLVEFKQPEV